MKNGLKLTLIQAEKFKTIILNINFHRPLTVRETSYGSLMSRILGRTSEKYPKLQLLSQRQDELYGMYSGLDLMKIGERLLFQFKTTYIHTPAIPENLHDEAFAMTEELLFNPHIVDGGFDPALFESERQMLIEEIENLIQDKFAYSLERSVQHLCSDEPYRHYLYGDIESLLQITPQSLYEYYLDFIQHSKIDALIMGGVLEGDAMERRMHALLDRPMTDIVPVPDEVIKPKTDQVRYVTETAKINQSKYIACYRTPEVYGTPYYYSTQLLALILGGSATSRLFNIIREQNSLCYAINAKVEKLKGLLFIIAGIDEVNAGRVEALTDEIILDLIENGVSDDEISTAKKLMKANLEGIVDYQYSLIGFYSNQTLLDDDRSVEEILEAINQVSKEDIQESAKRLWKDLVYVLKGEDAHE